jgi:hypothetical protein
MAGIKPGFITGANARVKLDGITLAYCTDLNFTVDVATIPIEVIGTYEVKSYEPVAYSVNGSFSVIRYTQKDGSTNPHNGAAASGTPADKIGVSNSVGKQLDPGRILTSSTFDLEIHQVAANSETTTAANSTYKIQDCRVTRRSSSLNKRGVMVDSYVFVGVLSGDTDSGQVTTVSHSGQQDLS